MLKRWHDTVAPSTLTASPASPPARFAGRVGDPAANGTAVLAEAQACHAEGAALSVFPELALSSYAIDDLLMQDALLDAVAVSVDALVAASRELRPLILVGAPVRWRHRLYNCALAIQGGHLLGVVPKAYPPNYREFYEHRQFASGATIAGEQVQLGRHQAPFGFDLLFEASDVPGFVVHAEICEDLWVPLPPSSVAALSGATVLANLSASNITIGKSDTRHLLTRAQSARCLAAYIYAAAGVGESTTDLAWDGQVTIDENGVNLAASDRFPAGAQHAIADIDLDLLRQERLRQGTFDDNAARLVGVAFRRIPFALDPPQGKDLGLQRRVERFPFVPADATRLAQDCFEAYNIQVSGLAQRSSAIGVKRAVIGVSGGLDSTHALIVVARAFDRLGLARDNILAYTLPGFATGDETKANALALMSALGVRAEEIDIRPAATQMLGDLGHPFAAGQAALRRHLRERAGRFAHGLSVPPRQPQRRHRHRHRRSLRAGARLVHLRRRRPDEPLQRQRRRAEDTDPARAALGDGGRFVFGRCRRRS